MRRGLFKARAYREPFNFAIFPRTKVILFAMNGNLHVVKFLVEQGTEIDQEDNEGWTPLHAAASCGFMDIARYK